MGRRGNPGFTLVELMVVIGIIAILSAIAIPLYRGYISNAKRSEAKTNLQSLRLLLEQYFAENGRYCPATDCTNESYVYKENNDGSTAQDTIRPNYLIGFAPKSAAAGGQAVLYDYSISFTSNTAYIIKATPVSSRGAPQGNLCIDQDGNKNISGCLPW
ncbi:MAG: type IV pilin protein [Thermodesulfovibrionales bacterium]